MTEEKKKKIASATNKKSMSISSKDYELTLAELKKQVQASQVKAAVAVNRELIQLYWNIGKVIAEKKAASGWGTSVIERLAKDLQASFPGIEGFSRTNVFRMSAFYTAYEKIPQAVGQFDQLPVFNIPWGHNAVILEKVKSAEERLWYAQKTIERGWSRSTLQDWIKSDLYRREGKAITNFATHLPDPQSRLAQETLKDPYNFDFFTLAEDYHEKELEQGLIDHIQKTLLELGQGFAFVGRQYPLKAGEKDLYIDLLFYHLKLRCYVVVELKAREFESSDAGQMSAYLSAVDDLLRHEDDKPTIGMILCRTKDNVFVEYAMRNFNRPIGVAEYEVKLTEKLPKEFKGSLPTIKEIEAELDKDLKD